MLSAQSLIGFDCRDGIRVEVHLTDAFDQTVRTETVLRNALEPGKSKRHILGLEIIEHITENLGTCRVYVGNGIAHNEDSLYRPVGISEHVLEASPKPKGVGKEQRRVVSDYEKTRNYLCLGMPISA